MTGPRPGYGPDANGFLPNGRPSTERLLADARERLETAEGMSARLAEVRGWARNEPDTIRVTVNSLGELVDIELAEIVLTADTTAIGAQIVALADRASRAAIEQSLTELAPALGDERVLALAESTGLARLVEPDAPVFPHEDGVLVPKPAPLDDQQPRASSDAPEDDEDDITKLDFSRFRSDR